MVAHLCFWGYSLQCCMPKIFLTQIVVQSYVVQCVFHVLVAFFFLPALLLALKHLMLLTFESSRERNLTGLFTKSVLLFKNLALFY